MKDEKKIIKLLTEHNSKMELYIKKQGELTKRMEDMGDELERIASIVALLTTPQDPKPS